MEGFYRQNLIGKDKKVISKKKKKKRFLQERTPFLMGEEAVFLSGR